MLVPTGRSSGSGLRAWLRELLLPYPDPIKPRSGRSRRSSAEIGEEQRDLTRGGLGRVRAVHDVVLHLEGEVTANGARGGLDRVRGAGERPERLDGAGALDDQGQQRAAGDELDERAEERALAVLAVVLLGDLDGQGAQLGGDQAQALGLQAGDDLADQATGDAVGLDQDERADTAGSVRDRPASTLVDNHPTSTYVDGMASPTDVTTAAAADDPAIGLRAIRALRDLADRLEVLQVGNARTRGWSWQQIADALGVSKQAVHKKHATSRRDR
jgi:hypothetical protein